MPKRTNSPTPPTEHVKFSIFLSCIRILRDFFYNYHIFLFTLLFGLSKKQKKQKKVTWSCEKDILSSDLTSSRSRHLSTLAINAAASSGSRLLLSIFRTAVPAASSVSRLLLSIFCRVPAASSGSGFPASTVSKDSDPPGSRPLLLSLSDFLSAV
jgi:hypothetical protein